MISQTMQDALNAQIAVEQYSAQMYLAMSAWLNSKSFLGFSHWMDVQSGEEIAHALKLVKFLLDRGGQLELQPIPAPRSTYGGPIEVFDQVLEHERVVSARIHALFELARQERDYASEITLQWYVSEQVEEESMIGQIVDRLRAIGDKGGAIWYLDKELGKRQRPPAA